MAVFVLHANALQQYGRVLHMYYCITQLRDARLRSQVV